MRQEIQTSLFEKIYTVTEITRNIKEVLEENFPEIWVEGEISNYKLHTSGHRYFTLKDENSQVRCVIWRYAGEYLDFEPSDGMKVVAKGEISVYEKEGKYQFYVAKLLPAGLGKLELAFQQLKEKLTKEGLFDEAHKNPIPEFPEKIGIVTSPTGAAIRDILHILKRRMPSVEIILNPVRVQGEGAYMEIARAIDEFNQYGEVDVLILTRGGGSLEDLWAFNEEEVARSIFRSQIPVISAVGHEIDFTIADFVADLRAPTPSAAAELVVKDKKEVLSQVKISERRLEQLLIQNLEFLKQRVKTATASWALRRPLDLLAQKSQRTDELAQMLVKAIGRICIWEKQKLNSLLEKLSVLSPLAVFERGYSLTKKLPRMVTVKDSSQLKEKDHIEVRFFKGKIKSQVEEVFNNW